MASSEDLQKSEHRTFRHRLAREARTLGAALEQAAAGGFGLQGPWYPTLDRGI
jgi:transposase